MHSLHKYGRILLYIKGNALAAEKNFKGALEQAPHHLPVLIDYAQSRPSPPPVPPFPPRAQPVSEC